MNGIGIGIGIDSVIGGGIPFKSDLNLRLVGRSGLDMVDDYGNNASILPSIGFNNPTNYLIEEVDDWEIGDSSGEFEFKFYFDGSNDIYRLFCSSDEAGLTKYFSFYVANKLVFIDIKGTSTNLLSLTTELTAGFRTVIVGSTGSAFYGSIDGVSSTITKITGADDGRWLNTVLSRNNISIGAKKTTTTTGSTSAYKIASVRYGNKHFWAITGGGTGKYVFDSIGSNNLIWAGSGHSYFDANGSSLLLDNGYSLWTKTGELNEYVPYKNGLPNDVSALLSGYTKISDHPGNADKHNLAASKIRIVGTNWDRSNATIFNTTARTGYYDSGNVNDYFISELKIQTLSTLFNTNYDGLNFSKFVNTSFDALYLDEILGYTTNKTAAQIDSILKYTKDYLAENYDEIFENSVLIEDKATYKIRNPFSRYSFYTSGKAVLVKANPTQTSIPTYAAITVFVNGVYNQSKVYGSFRYLYIDLPAGDNKLITLVEGATSKPLTEVLGCFITSIKTDTTYSKKTLSTPSEKMLFIGDSITVGQKTTTPATQSFPNTFNITDSKDVTTYGWGFMGLSNIANDSTNINNTVSVITSLFGSATTKKLVFALGTNDAALLSLSAANYKTYYENLLDAIHLADDDIEVFILSPLLRNDAFNATLIDYDTKIDELQVSRADYVTVISGQSILTYPADFYDNVHPNNTGTPKIYTALKAVIYP